MPIVDRSIVLHSRIAAEVGAVRDHPKQIPRLKGFAYLTALHITSLPLPVFLDRLHEPIRDPHGIIGILKKDAAVGWPIQAGVISGFDERPSLLLFFDFALDEFFDVRVIK